MPKTNHYKTACLTFFPPPQETGNLNILFLAQTC
jgi:hypothetical protein